MSDRVKKTSRHLTCEHDGDPATAVCGECGKPLCEDHERTLTDPLFSQYKNDYTHLLLGIVGFVVVPAVLLGVVDASLFADVERQLFDQTIGLHTGLLLTGVLTGFGGLLATWFQSGDQKTSARVLTRNPPERALCEECYQSTSLRRLLSVALVGLGALLILAGPILVVQAGNGGLLALSGLGAIVYYLRHDAVLYTLGPSNSDT
ncbi:hypothetical protein [Halapricum desulfuricans]|uniref:Uncharacterized protein n=1 Tax=Halapricum desulfuricans TaxID=2841257 RepID=A0A897NPL3_9EURY|nr:hypothetical protein [Halapricum desulfuricans]QSG14181.1 hypothetical protein HSEST_0635 [Halapricum desulfuricans]